MGKIKSEKGAITILVLVSMLFMVSFLITTYVVIANKVQTQKEIIKETKKIYENDKSIEEIYNSYIDNDNIIPIYNAEQLEIALSGVTQEVEIEGKYYRFSNNEDITYNIINTISIQRNEEDNLNISDLNANFTGKSVIVTYLDSNENTYTIEYEESNKYDEPESEIMLTPIKNEIETAHDAHIYVSYYNNDSFTEYQELGEGIQTLRVKRLSRIKVYSTCDGYKNSDEIVIEAKRLNEDYILVNGNWNTYTFTIASTEPANAIVLINGEERKTISVSESTNGYISYTVSATNYDTIEQEIYINSNTTIPLISLNENTHNWSEWGTEANATCTSTGTLARECSQCGTKEIQTIPALGHNYQLAQTVDPSYAGIGYHQYTCSRCNDTYRVNRTDTPLTLVNVGEYDSSAWTATYSRTNSNGSGRIYLSNLDGTPTFCIAASYSGTQTLGYTGPINLTDAKSISFSGLAWNDYRTSKTSLGKTYYAYGIDTYMYGIARESDLVINNTSYYRLGASGTYSRLNTSDKMSIGRTIDVSDLTGNYYIKLYTKHTTATQNSSKISASSAYTAYTYFDSIVINYQ